MFFFGGAIESYLNFLIFFGSCEIRKKKKDYLFIFFRNLFLLGCVEESINLIDDSNEFKKYKKKLNIVV